MGKYIDIFLTNYSSCQFFLLFLQSLCWFDPRNTSPPGGSCFLLREIAFTLFHLFRLFRLFRLYSSLFSFHFSLMYSVSRSPNVTPFLKKNKKEKALPLGKAFSSNWLLTWYQLAETGADEALYPRIRLMRRSEGIKRSSPKAFFPICRVSRVDAICGTDEANSSSISVSAFVVSP